MNAHPSGLALRRFELFQELTAEKLDALARRCQWRSVAAGQPILLRQQRHADVFLIVDGRVRVTIYGAQGRQVTFRDVMPGEIVGDLSALDDGPRSADVVTMSGCVIAVLDQAAFLALLVEEPMVARRLMQRLARLVRQLSERVIELSTFGVQNRLHAELLRLANACADDGAKEAEVRIPAPRHADLASQISTTREQVTRELNALTRSGLLRKEGPVLVVTDPPRLAQMVADVRGETLSGSGRPA
ncbi:MAG: Crp/Fnr family transcriptional regulator [Variovorax sp.]|nr:Crp/Fnr family transcriptional regulator [Variovorax sp.]